MVARFICDGVIIPAMAWEAAPEVASRPPSLGVSLFGISPRCVNGKDLHCTALSITRTTGGTATHAYSLRSSSYNGKVC